jgi:hypothetical protein
VPFHPDIEALFARVEVLIEDIGSVGTDLMREYRSHAAEIYRGVDEDGLPREVAEERILRAFQDPRARIAQEQEPLRRKIVMESARRVIMLLTWLGVATEFGVEMLRFAPDGPLRGWELALPELARLFTATFVSGFVVLIVTFVVACVCQFVRMKKGFFVAVHTWQLIAIRTIGVIWAIVSLGTFSSLGLALGEHHAHIFAICLYTAFSIAGMALLVSCFRRTNWALRTAVQLRELGTD